VLKSFSSSDPVGAEVQFAITSGRILNPSGSGWWDDRTSANPIILPPSSTQPKWLCYYYGRSSATWNNDLPAFLPTGCSGVAESVDGLNWTRIKGPEKEGAILVPSSNPDDFDHVHVGINDVIPTGDGGYTCFYFGGSTEPLNLGFGPPGPPLKGFKMRPGIATSIDSITFNKSERSPILDMGGKGEWDEIFVSWPRVLRLNEENDEEWLMTYHALMPVNPPRWGVGAAISKSGLTGEY